MRATFLFTLLTTALLATQSTAELSKHQASHSKRAAPDVYNIPVKNLTPESTIWDRAHKLFYQSNLWKGQVSVWNPATRKHFNLNIPGVTSNGNGDQQMAGLVLSTRTDAKFLYGVCKDAAAFRFGPDQSSTGPSSYHAWKLPVHKDQNPTWSVDLNPVQKALHKKYGTRPFGPVASAIDADGYSYVVFALGMPAVARISPDGKVVEAWSGERPNGSQRPGYTGVTYVPSSNKIIAFGGPRPLTSWDLNSKNPKPTAVTIHGSFGSLDGTEKIVMVPSTTSGSGPRLLGAKAPTVYSFRSSDNFDSVHFKTYQRDELRNSGFTAVTEAGFGGGRQIYAASAFFGGGPRDGRDEYPLYRIPSSMLE